MSVIGAIMVPHPPIILPEVGKGEERKISATNAAYEKAAALAAELKPDTIIIASPHSIMYADYFHISPGRSAKGDMSRFGAPGVKISAEYDTEFVRRLEGIAKAEGFPAGTLGERSRELDHGTLIPLYYIDHNYTDYKLVRIGLSGLSLQDHYRLGMMIAAASEQLQRRVLFVGSGDLSHKLLAEGPYGLAPEGPVYDERIMDVMGRAAFGELMDFDESFCDRAAECGHRSFCILAGALDGLSVETKRLSHEGTFGVGYGVCTYKVNGKNPEREFLRIRQTRELAALEEKKAKEDPYVRLARFTVEQYIRERKRIRIPQDLPESLRESLPMEMMQAEAGVFVSLHKEGRLRGCIGTIAAVRPCIAEEIVENAISASTRDPRFSPVRPDELPLLEISVDVLGEAERIRSKEELDVKRYGVIVTKGHKRGLLLPNLDGVDTIKDQVSIALQKAGLFPREKNYELQRFEVVRHE
ncbi:MAG: AmmeMemoRadiSam system protein A [Lachnospiraceae bacterium]|nr:AmmeMemoRadiSam system protein A [Lachnospiraceae bacterium]